MPGPQWLWVNKPLQRTPSIISPRTMCGTDAGPRPRRIGPQHLDSGQGTLSLPGLVQSPHPHPPPRRRSPFLLGCLGGQLSTETSLGSSSVPSLSLGVGEQPPPSCFCPPPPQLLRVQRGLEFHLGDYSGASGALLHLRAKPD